jgi:hypothetical protein
VFVRFYGYETPADNGFMAYLVWAGTPHDALEEASKILMSILQDDVYHKRLPLSRLEVEPEGG